jgi:hypothetical protein
MALLKRFFNQFCRIVSCWKGLETRNLDLLQVITSCKENTCKVFQKRKYTRKNVSNLMEYCMIPPSSIYVWKEERPEKPVLATRWQPKLKKINFTNKNQS